MHTYIQLKTETRDRLKSIGKKGESYDAIINRLLDQESCKGYDSSHLWRGGYSLPLNPIFRKWSFAELRSIVEYKAAAIGKKVVAIDPRYTSRTCSKCGFQKKENRNGKTFKCKSCGFQIDADLNASRNIATFSRSDRSRLSVNQPIVASVLTISYKPANSLAGSWRRNIKAVS